MRTSSITVFCKQATCPSAETLLSYQSSSLTAGRALLVTEHLSSCEFCGAELLLLAEHVPLEEEYLKAEIPAHLYHLAEALLGKTELSQIISLPESSSCEPERLTLTDA
jgi:hypothetical protein